MDNLKKCWAFFDKCKAEGKFKVTTINYITGCVTPNIFEDVRTPESVKCGESITVNNMREFIDRVLRDINYDVTGLHVTIEFTNVDHG